MLRIAMLTCLAMLAFAANSVLARLALAGGDADALGYTGVRLAAGALMLGAILALRREPGSPLRIDGSWSGAAALMGYALAFSLAYVMLGAGTGALILFASVQIGMLVWALQKRERPGSVEWLGFALAFAALAFLVAPGLAAPDPVGTVLMVAAGLSWAAYSLIGRSSRLPLADTAGNFIRCLPLSIVLVAMGMAIQTPTLAGLAYAVASGAIASGLGYAIWYSALPGLTRTGASFVQLTVPA
ncbi:MAG TPA: DMT family transporter, partial [Saliniramus sp.]|nr:DMT family transporter [Saliniramus sp.]